MSRTYSEIWLLGQAVKTSPFHGGNTGSIPVGVIDAYRIGSKVISIVLYFQTI